MIIGVTLSNEIAFLQKFKTWLVYTLQHENMKCKFTAKYHSVLF